MFHESYGTMPTTTLNLIKRSNVSPADWDMMLYRWGMEWNNPDLPWDAIEQHIITHTVKGSYRWPMYG